MDEHAFVDVLSTRPPSYKERIAFADWLAANGRDGQAKYIRHRAEMFCLTSPSQLYQFHAKAADEIGKSIPDEWLSTFRTDYTLQEKLDLECYPLKR